MRDRRTDIHFHLLPGVDDGPATMEEAIVLARAAVDDGTASVIVTPHVRPDFVTDVSDLRDRVRELKTALARADVPLGVSQGGELGHEMVGRLRQPELDSIAQGPPRRRWLLLEAPFAGMGPEFNRAADELRDRGFGIVLAHPERSRGLLGSRNAHFDHELAAGSALQVNAFSLAGRHGEEARSVALRLVRAGLVTAVASDAHSAIRRPALTLAEQVLLADGISPSIASRLVGWGPRGLLAGGLAPVAWHV